MLDIFFEHFFFIILSKKPGFVRRCKNC